MPIPERSITNIEKSTIAEQVNDVFREASQGALKGILDFTELPLVSSDFKGTDVSSTIDGSLTMVNFVDFDSHYGHRRDIEGYAKALEHFDQRLPEFKGVRSRLMRPTRR